MEAANNGDYDIAVEKLTEAIGLIGCASKKAHRAKLFMNLALVHRMYDNIAESRRAYENAVDNLNPFNRGQSILIGRIRDKIEELERLAA